MKLFVIKEAIVFSLFYYSFITIFLQQRVIRPELKQRLSNLVGQVDKYMNRTVAKTPSV